MKERTTLTYWRIWSWRLLPRGVCTNLPVPCEPARAVPASCVPPRGPSPRGEPSALRATCGSVPVPPSLVSVLQWGRDVFRDNVVNLRLVNLNRGKRSWRKVQISLRMQKIRSRVRERDINRSVRNWELRNQEYSKKTKLSYLCTLKNHHYHLLWDEEKNYVYTIVV